MGFRKNNVLHRNHFRKDWQRRVKTWFDQPGKKSSRRSARQEKATSLGARPLELVRPAVRCPTVKYNMRVRAGRGFTFEELKAAGINKKAALSIGIPVDHRRKNRSEESLARNVERLKAYKAKLIVFPIKSKKPKKGDSQGEDLTAPTTRSVSSVLPISQEVASEAPRAITAEEKEFNAYTTLRKARSDARLVGVRAAREKKKQEEEDAKKYLALKDDDLTRDRLQARTLCQRYNNHPFVEWSEGFQNSDLYGPASRLQNLADLFRIPLERTAQLSIEPPFYCDYGYNIEFKGEFYCNFGAVVLDCAKISFGERTVMGPGVHIYGATHSVHVDERLAGYERAYPVELGDDCWIGGGAKIIGPSKIGKNCTIAANATVIGDFPDNCVIGGTPARILKRLEEPTGEIQPTDRRLMVVLPGAKSAAKNDLKKE